MRIALSMGRVLSLALIALAAQACASNATSSTAGGADSSTASDGATADATSNDSTTSSDGATTTPDDSGSGNASTDSSANGPSDSSGGGAEASSPNDGAAGLFDANDVPEGGAPVTPKQVACGGNACDTTANTCCVQSDAAASCLPGANTTCPSGATIHCLGALDCSSGSVCCGSFDLFNNTASTACSAKACPSGLTQVQFCRTNSECPSGTCTVQVCPSPAKPGTAPQILELCGGVHVGCAAR